MKKERLRAFCGSASALLLISLVACGGGSSGGTGGGGGGTAPAAPTGLTAAAGDQQVSLTWKASSGATSYIVGRSLASGGPYNTISRVNGFTNDTDKLLTNGVTYFYVVAAANSAGTSANSS